jgi:RND family efflux transporter MFP subunit
MKSPLKTSPAVVLLALLAPALLAPAVLAQEKIAISDADISRMGIVFAPVKAMDNNAGARFPATVINSPDSVTTLSARYSGVIEEWQQTSGSAVSAGQTLAVIRSPEILTVQNDWIAATAEDERAQFELKKDQTLFDQGVIAEQRLVQTRNRARQAAFAEKSARAQLALAGFDQAHLKALRESGAGLGSYPLVSPASAVLTQRIGNVGSYVEANMPLAYLNSGERRWVSIHVPGRFASDLAVGQTLTVAGTSETLTLRQKDYVIDSSNQTIELFAEFDRESGFTTGEVISVVLPPSRQGVLVPDRAVVHSGNVATVYVRTASGVEARELTLRPLGAEYLAETGLSAGERVAIQGSAVLKGIQLGLGGSE